MNLIYKLKQIISAKFIGIIILIIYIVYTNFVIYWKGPLYHKINDKIKQNIGTKKDYIKFLKTFAKLSYDTEKIIPNDSILKNLPDIFDPVKNKKNPHYDAVRNSRNVNQYSCGSCVVATIIGCLETYYHKIHGFNVDRTFSMQHLLDCRKERDSLPYCRGAFFVSYDKCNIILDKCNQYVCHTGCVAQDKCDDLWAGSYWNITTNKSKNITMVILSLILLICVIIIVYLLKYKRNNILILYLIVVILVSILCMYFIGAKKLGKLFLVDPSNKQRVYAAIIYSVIALFSFAMIFIIKKLLKYISGKFFQGLGKFFQILCIIICGVFYTFALRYIYKHILIDYYVKDIYRKIYYLLICLANFGIIIFTVNPWINIISKRYKKLIYMILILLTIVFISGYSLLFINPFNFDIYDIPEEDTNQENFKDNVRPCALISDCRNIPVNELLFGKITKFISSGNSSNLQNNRSIMKYMIQKYGGVCSSWDWTTFNFDYDTYVFTPIRNEQDYKNFSSAIYDDNPDNISGHAVQLVGWKKINNKDVWIIKNSWGSNWGDSGFMYIEMFDMNNPLHIDSLKYTPINRLMFLEYGGVSFPDVELNSNHKFVN